VRRPRSPLLCPIESKRQLASPHSKALHAGVPVVAGMDGLAGPGKLADLVVIFAGGRETLRSVPPQ
jgi:hypothetical protein